MTEDDDNEACVSEQEAEKFQKNGAEAAALASQTTGTLDVNDDEAIPAIPPSNFGFPSGPEWADFLDEAGGSGLPEDEDDEDDRADDL